MTNMGNGKIWNLSQTKYPYRSIIVSQSPLKFFKLLPKDFSAIIIILHRILHKTEAIDITDVGLPICAQQVKSTNCLLSEKATTCSKLAK